MTANSNNPQQSSNIVQSTSNNPQIVPDSTGQVATNSSNTEPPAVSLKILGSRFSLHFSKWVVLGIFGIATIATFFFLTKGSEFCFFSTCSQIPDTTSTMATNFWAFAGGTAALVILTSFFGVALAPAVAASFGLWFLIQMTLH